MLWPKATTKLGQPLVFRDLALPGPLYHLHIRLANKLHKINSGHEMPEYFLYICNAAHYLFDLTNKKTFWLWKNIQNVVKCHNLFQCNTLMLCGIH